MLVFFSFFRGFVCWVLEGGAQAAAKRMQPREFKRFLPSSTRWLQKVKCNDDSSHTIINSEFAPVEPQDMPNGLTK